MTKTAAARRTDNLKKNDQAEHPDIKIERFRVGDLHIDQRVQREKITESKLNRIRQKYSPRFLGTFEVSRRANGKLVLLDGMHRRTVILEREPERENFEVNCTVHTGLSLQEEAELFVALNDQQAATPLDLHKVRVVQEDPVALALNQAVESYGWTIGAGTGRIGAVKVLETLYYAGEEAFEDGGYGSQLVQDTVGVLTNAWGHDKNAVSQNILKYVGAFILDVECWIADSQKPDDYFDYELLADAMSREFKLGPSAWAAARREAGRAGGKPFSETMRESLVDIYNRKQSKRSRRLPDQLRVPTRIKSRSAGA